MKARVGVVRLTGRYSEKSTVTLTTTVVSEKWADIIYILEESLPLSDGLNMWVKETRNQGGILYISLLQRSDASY